MKASNIYTQVKSTLLGFVFIAAAIAGVLTFSDFNMYIFFVLLGSGVLLLFAKDEFIDWLINFIKNIGKLLGQK